MQCVYAVCICRMLCNLCMCCVWAVCVCCAVYAACHCVPLRVCHVYVSPLWVSFVRVPFLCAVRYAYWCACVCCVPLVCAVCFLCVWALSYEVYYMGCCVPVRCLCLYDVYWVSAPHVCVICMCRVMCMCRLSVCDGIVCVMCLRHIAHGTHTQHTGHITHSTRLLRMRQANRWWLVDLLFIALKQFKLPAFRGHFTLMLVTTAHAVCTC